MKERFEVLDIFRGIFATLVVFFHLNPFTDTIILNNNFIRNADLFVDFFFVLSGFVIAYRYQSIASFQELKSFYKKRFFRLYPLHFIMLIAFLFMEIAKQLLTGHIQVNQLNNENNNVLTFISSLTLLNSVQLPSVTDVSWNIPSWSISAEMIAYLFFGVVMLIIHNYKAYRIRNLIYLALVVSVFMGLYFFAGDLRLTYSFDYGFLRGILGFFTGVLCLNAYQFSTAYLKRKKALFFHLTETVLVVLIIVLVYQGEALKETGFIFEMLFFSAILIFAFEKGFLSQLLKKSTVLHKMGKYSYSIYLTHALFISLFNVLFIRILKFSPADYSYLFILNYILLFKVSEWTYKHIELRFMFWEKNLKEEKMLLTD